MLLPNETMVSFILHCPSTWHTTRDDLKFLIFPPLTPRLLQQVWTNMPHLYSSRNQTQGFIHAGQALYLLPTPQHSGCRSASKLKPIQHITWPHHSLRPHQKTNSWGNGGKSLLQAVIFETHSRFSDLWLDSLGLQLPSPFRPPAPTLALTGWKDHVGVLRIRGHVNQGYEENILAFTKLTRVTIFY